MSTKWATHLALIISVSAGTAGTAMAQPGTPPLAAPQSQDEKMQWFRQAKFGLFIHWGLYAIPAGEWKGQKIAGPGEWIMNRMRIPVTVYEQLAQQFNPVKFNAEEWMQMAEDAGMKFIVITSKHADGFAMYGSKVSPYNIVDATPFHRDPLKELATAAAHHHIRFGIYYSHSPDWHEPGGPGNTWDFGTDDKKDIDQYQRGKVEPQVKELLSGYGPVGLIWCDTTRIMTGDRTLRFMEILRTMQPAALIPGVLGTVGDFRSMGDNSIPNQVVQGDWIVPVTLNHTWGYKKDDNDWKTPEEVTFQLVDTVSKGGNYLLNVGPTAEGVFPQPSQDSLRAVGRWLKVNGEAIYGAGPTLFGDELGSFDNSRQDKKGRPVFAQATAWRCTTKPGRLYIHLFTWPGKSFELNKVKLTVTRAYMLAEAGRKALNMKQSGEKVAVTLPAKPTSQYASVLVLETAN